jgi:hypothetical protein
MELIIPGASKNMDISEWKYKYSMAYVIGKIVFSTNIIRETIPHAVIFLR